MRNSEERGGLRTHLLKILQENSDRPNKDLAYDLKIDPSSLSRLRDRLEKDKYIVAYKAILDPLKFGYTTLAYIQISINEQTGVSNTLEFLLSQPEIQEIHHIQGEFDMLLKVRAKSNADIMSFIQNKLNLDRNIKRTNTTITMGTVKETTDIPI